MFFCVCVCVCVSVCPFIIKPFYLFIFTCINNTFLFLFFLSSRRSSITSIKIAGAGGSGSKADPRPISSKTFQSETISAVVEYCASTSYCAGPISAKILGNPTGKDFANIVSHLCSRIDSSYTLIGRIEDEVQTVFKVLRYGKNNFFLFIIITVAYFH